MWLASNEIPLHFTRAASNGFTGAHCHVRTDMALPTTVVSVRTRQVDAPRRSSERAARAPCAAEHRSSSNTSKQPPTPPTRPTSAEQQQRGERSNGSHSSCLPGSPARDMYQHRVKDTGGGCGLPVCWMRRPRRATAGPRPPGPRRQVRGCGVWGAGRADAREEVGGELKLRRCSRSRIEWFSRRSVTGGGWRVAGSR